MVLSFQVSAQLFDAAMDVPALSELIAELNIARDLSAQHARLLRLESPGMGSTTPEPALTFRNDGPARSLREVQGDWVRSILCDPLADSAPILSRLSQGHRFDVYHHAYQARLAESLADTYTKTMRYMGGDSFAVHAKSFALQQPPRVSNLNEYGQDFPLALCMAHLNRPELAELAMLEWHLRDVFGAPNEAVLQRSDLANDEAMTWLHRANPLPSHARLMPVTRSVAQIWNAIHHDQEIPPVTRLSETTQLLVWRKGKQPHFVSLCGAELALIQDMLSGHSISDAWERNQTALDGVGHDFMTACLERWLSLELLRFPTGATVG